MTAINPQPGWVSAQTLDPLAVVDQVVFDDGSLTKAKPKSTQKPKEEEPEVEPAAKSTKSTKSSK